MRKFYLALGVLTLVGAVAVGYAMRGGSAATEPVDLGDLVDSELVALAQGVVDGDAEAPVTIMEFGNYQCPACMTFALQVKPQIDLAYIESGQAKFRYHDFPIQNFPHSFLAARAARCAGDQDRYFDYHDEVYRTLPEWSTPRDPSGHFRDLARDVGLDGDAFGDCLDSERHADVVTANFMLGQRMGVAGTPTVFVHSQGRGTDRLAGFTFIDVQRAVEAALEG